MPNLPEYLVQWSRMTFDDLAAWAGSDGFRWNRARYFAEGLIAYGIRPFPPRQQAGI